MRDPHAELSDKMQVHTGDGGKAGWFAGISPTASATAPPTSRWGPRSRTMARDFAVGIEVYTDAGTMKRPALPEQAQTLYGAIDAEDGRSTSASSAD